MATMMVSDIFRDREEFEQWLPDDEPSWLRVWRRHCWQWANERLLWPESRYTRLVGFQPERYTPVRSIPSIKRPSDRDTRSSVQVIVRADGIALDPVPSDWRSALTVRRFRDMVTDGDERLRAFLEENRFLIPLEAGKPAAYLYGLWADGLWIEFHRNDAERPVPVTVQLQRTEDWHTMVFPIVVFAHPRSWGSLLVELKSEGLQWSGLWITGLQVYVQESAQVQIQCLWNDAERAYDFIFHHATLDRDARLQWYTGWFGSRLTQARHHMRVNAPGAELQDVHVLFGHGRQHFDSQIFVQHTGPYTKSNTMMRGVLKDRSRNVFYGLVRLEPEAQNADAYLQDHIMLLNPGAHSDSIPALEIEAHQVRCGHSASVGEVDEDQIFYLMSRGLDEREARRLLIEGFLAPAMEAITVEAVRERIVAEIERKWREA